MFLWLKDGKTLYFLNVSGRMSLEKPHYRHDDSTRHVNGSLPPPIRAGPPSDQSMLGRFSLGDFDPSVPAGTASPSPSPLPRLRVSLTSLRLSGGSLVSILKVRGRSLDVLEGPGAELRTSWFSGLRPPSGPSLLPGSFSGTVGVSPSPSPSNTDFSKALFHQAVICDVLVL